MPPAEPTAFFTEPMAVFGYLAALIAFIFWLSGLPALRKLFDVTPPILYAYFLPTLSTAFGITPSASPVYDWMTRYLLPFALLLLMITVDLKAIARLGPIALVMLLAGSIGIVIGAPVAYLLFGSMLPEEAWKGFAALAGSWIGGSANMIAIKESVGASDAIMGPIIVVDTIVAYGWMGLLLFFSGWQTRYDRRMKANTTIIAETNERLLASTARMKPLDTRMAIIIIGIGFAGAIAAIAAGNALPNVGSPTIISKTTWAVLIVVTGGLLLSFTPARQLEEAGASRIGYAGLFMLLTAIGARADLRAVLDAPLFLVAGVVWLAIHVIILLVVGRLLRAPLFFFAAASMANIGGPASAPVVAGVYHPALAPVGLLMAVAGYIIGIYGGLLCAWMLGVLAA